MQNFLKLTSGLLVLALAEMTAQAAAPSLSYKINGNELVINYTGTLLQSTDAVTWTQVTSASSPYKVALSDKKQFFCAKGEEDPGKNITIPLSDTVDLDMIWIEPGIFTMGSPDDELGRWDGEVQHKVRLTKGFWLGKYEVTQAQYKAIMGTNPSYQPDEWGVYHGVGENYPVYYVSWEDAMEFCKRLTEIEKAAGRLTEGYEYTLPTEAQWEYACRAGTTTALNNGKNLSNKYKCPEMDEVGWYDGNSNSKTHPVGQKQPNAWGLYDMHGNVDELCLDLLRDYPTSFVVDPIAIDPDSRWSSTWIFVIRGGDWITSASSCRSADRSYGIFGEGFSFIGFRVALTTRDITVPVSDKVNLDLIWIEPGTFMMGSPEDELGRWDDEVQHKVTLTEGYWLGKYEVTQAQYEAIMGTNPSYTRGDNNPVEEVSWNDAMEFCKKLTAQENAAGRLPVGYEYTLPTEAQWEYACRAGTTTALNSGKNLSNTKQCPEMDEVGWYTYNSDKKTHPVGQKQPNAWGLYDMHGNVLEWCLDWYGSYPTSFVKDPTGASTGKYRVYRGGAYRDSDAFSCRSASRAGNTPDFYNNNRGFRVVLSKSNKEILTITINHSKTYDGTPLTTTYTRATTKGLMAGDYLTAGAVTTSSANAGSYSYPDGSVISTPFATEMGIDNYSVVYIINQTITQ